MKNNIFFLLLFVIGLASCSSKPEATAGPGALSKDSVLIIAKAAYMYAVPLALMDITRRKITNTETPVDSRAAPVNQFFISTRFPDAKFTSVVRPNADTYYTSGFLDLTPEPIVLTVPDTRGRYYLLPMLDAFGNVFASPGKRTTGTQADTFLIAGPRWTGTAPAGMKLIKAPGSMVWILGRIQVNNAADGKQYVVPLEKKITMTPLSFFGKPYTAPKGTVDPELPAAGPNEQLLNMPTDSFFNDINRLLISNPPAAADSIAMSLFARIGVGPGLKFDLHSFDTATQAGLKQLPEIFKNMAHEVMSRGVAQPVNGWSVAYKGFGNYGTDYDLRAMVCYMGLGANLPEDAVYPMSHVDADGNPYDGANKYILHFEKGEAPPVHAFWSITMYNDQGYFIENPMNRYAIGDRNPLQYNPDSSVDLYIQHVSPGKNRENNWLPAPAGPFNLALRMYWPAEKFLQGNWTPPAVVKQKQ
ncbi:MAG TPA: hypothetical protein DIC22_07890 [Chitinophagaceae bacterium]|nr:hypothetical protein [Chitinophagaceae bacterium]